MKFRKLYYVILSQMSYQSMKYTRKFSIKIKHHLPKRACQLSKRVHAIMSNMWYINLLSLIYLPHSRYQDGCNLFYRYSIVY